MNAVDTNILIYRLDRADQMKRAKARQLLQDLHSQTTPTLLLWQVAGEFARQLWYWVHQDQISPAALRRYFQVTRKLFPLCLPTANVLDRALALAERYSLSHWDSMLLSACIEAGVDTLYTEDMGAPVQIDSVRLVNPFV